MKVLAPLIVLLGIVVISIDQWRIVATGHDFHWMPVASGGFLMLVGLYPDRVIGILERIAPSAMERITGKPKQPPPANGVEGE